MRQSLLRFEKPETIGQWLVFFAATGIILTSPTGTRTFLKELHRYLRKQRGAELNKKDAKQLSQTLYVLKKRKVIRIRQMKGGKTRIELTEKGRKRKLQYDLEKLKIPKQARWDGKWRILMFDIPEEKKTARDAMRRKLSQLGFEQFQKSVWIYPYPCENEIDFIAEFFSVAKYVNLIIVNIENDKPLRAKFGL